VRLNPSNVAAISSSVEEFRARCRGGEMRLRGGGPPRAAAGRKSRARWRRSPRAAIRLLRPGDALPHLRLLLESGYRVEQVHLVDLFLGFHIESVFHLARQS
jgi:hypothetical protein